MVNYSFGKELLRFRTLSILFRCLPIDFRIWSNTSLLLVSFPHSLPKGVLVHLGCPLHLTKEKCTNTVQMPVFCTIHHIYIVKTFCKISPKWRERLPHTGKRAGLSETRREILHFTPCSLCFPLLSLHSAVKRRECKRFRRETVWPDFHAPDS